MGAKNLQTNLLGKKAMFTMGISESEIRRFTEYQKTLSPQYRNNFIGLVGSISAVWIVGNSLKFTLMWDDGTLFNADVEMVRVLSNEA